MSVQAFEAALVIPGQDVGVKVEDAIADAVVPVGIGVIGAGFAFGWGEEAAVELVALRVAGGAGIVRPVAEGIDDEIALRCAVAAKIPGAFKFRDVDVRIFFRPAVVFFLRPVVGLLDPGVISCGVFILRMFGPIDGIFGAEIAVRGQIDAVVGHVEAAAAAVHVVVGIDGFEVLVVFQPAGELGGGIEQCPAAVVPNGKFVPLGVGCGAEIAAGEGGKIGRFGLLSGQIAAQTVIGRNFLRYVRLCFVGGGRAAGGGQQAGDEQDGDGQQFQVWFHRPLLSEKKMGSVYSIAHRREKGD